MTITLPGEYTFGRIVARFLHAIADTPDDADKLPEARPAKGKVTFKPETRLIKSSVDYRAFILNETVSVDIDPFGYLIDSEGSKLLSTNPSEEDLEPHRGIWLATGNWEVTVSIPGVAFPKFSFTLTEEYTEDNPLDLTVAIPPQPGPNQTINILSVPKGGGPRDTLVLENGKLVWSSELSDAIDAVEVPISPHPEFPGVLVIGE